MNENEERDEIEGTDEDGNRVLLHIIRYFYYNGEEYVLLGEQPEDGEIPKNGEVTQYVMRVEESIDEDGEEIEDFVPVNRDLMETLIEVIHTDYTSLDNDNYEQEIDDK